MMLEVEARLGRSLEEDFQEYYIEKGWGQKRLANRWGVGRNLIFGRVLRGGRRSWAEMLDLPVRTIARTALRAVRATRPCCEICGWSEGPLDGAHFVPRAAGGPGGWNILQLCPNCHRLLDSGSPEILQAAKEVLLKREAGRILEEVRDDTEARRRLLWIAERVVNR